MKYLQSHTSKNLSQKLPALIERVLTTRMGKKKTPVIQLQVMSLSLSLSLCMIEMMYKRRFVTDKNGEEEDTSHPAAGHEEDLGDVLRLLVLPN